MILHGKAKLDQMVADGVLDIEDANQVDRFAAFLRNSGPPDCTCDKAALNEEGERIPHRHVDPTTYAYAMGEDVDPPGTGEPW